MMGQQPIQTTSHKEQGRTALHNDEKNCNLLPIPVEILVTHVLKYLPRKDWNALSCINQEMRHASQHVIPPWPTCVGWTLPSSIYSLAFYKTPSHDDLDDAGTTLAVGREDGVLSIWDQRFGNIFSTGQGGHLRTITSLDYSPHKKLLASASQDRTIRLWDPDQDYCCKRVLEDYGATGNTTPLTVQVVRFSPDGTYLASGTWRGTIVLWHVETGKPLRVFEGHALWVKSIGFSLENSGSNNDIFEMYSAGEDNTIRKWTLSRDSLQIVTTDDLDEGANDESMSDRHNNHHDREPREEIMTVYHYNTIAEAVAFSSNGTLWGLSQGHDNSIEVLSTTKIKDHRHDHLYTLEGSGHDSGVSALCFSPNGSRLASASSDGSICTGNLDPSTRAIDSVVIQKGRGDHIHALAFQPDNESILASATDNGVLQIWHLPSSILS